ncbi:MAG: hypothetical protein ABIW49_00260 [Knoellia sp.]
MNCKSSKHIVRRDVLVAGWLVGNEGGAPYVNMCDNVKCGHTHGVEDIHYNVLFDPVFTERMYGAQGLSAALQGADLPGNLGSGQPSLETLPLAARHAPGDDPVMTFDSWFLPDSEFHLHGELNAWHEHDSGHVFGRHYKGRGPAPAGWVNPPLRNDAMYPGFVDRNCWFPFDVLNPRGDASGRLHAGDYVLLRGPLWQDNLHDEGGAEESWWDASPGLRGHGGPLEMHPVDWVVRLSPPAVNARQSGRSLALCTEPGQAADPPPFEVYVEPKWPPTRPTSSLHVRDVATSIDARFTDPGTFTHLVIESLDTNVKVTGRLHGEPHAQARFKGSWRVSWRETDLADRQWVDFNDALPSGAQTFTINESWLWRDHDPKAYIGARHHVSSLANGIHQHWFQGPRLSAQPMTSGDRLFTHVSLSRQHPPRSLMVQWLGDDGWEHRAYWGDDLMPWGSPETASRHGVGALPFADEWVRLEVPAAAVGLIGQHVTGMAFTLYDGEAVWDYAGVRLGPAPPSPHPPLRVSVSPPATTEGIRSLRVSTHDALGSPVTGRVILRNSLGETDDIGATNQSIVQDLDAGRYRLIVRCPGYAETSLPFTVGPARR